MNVLIGEDGLMKVMDFGTSRVKDASGVMTSTIGTTAWIAPELFLKRPYSEKADIYSYAVLVWEIVNFGNLPFSEFSSFEVPEKVVKGARPNLEGLKVHPILEKVMRCCWDHRPFRRPNMAEVAIFLESATENFHQKN